MEGSSSVVSRRSSARAYPCQLLGYPTQSYRTRLNGAPGWFYIQNVDVVLDELILQSFSSMTYTIPFLNTFFGSGLPLAPKVPSGFRY